MPFTDPMADGPAIQAAGLRALAAGQTMAKTLDSGARIPQGRRRDADRADGLLQSDLHLRRRKISRRREGGRRRRPDHRRPAARGGRGAVPAGAARPGSTSSASRRRPPTTSACRPCSRTPRASSTTSRSPASPAPPRPIPARSRTRSRASSATPGCRSRSASACAPPSMRARSPKARTAWWSAPRWSRRCGQPRRAGQGDGAHRRGGRRSGGAACRRRARRDAIYRGGLAKGPCRGSHHLSVADRRSAARARLRLHLGLLVRRASVSGQPLGAGRRPHRADDALSAAHADQRHAPSATRRAGACRRIARRWLLARASATWCCPRCATASRPD